MDFMGRNRRQGWLEEQGLKGGASLKWGTKEKVKRVMTSTPSKTPHNREKHHKSTCLQGYMTWSLPNEAPKSLVYA